MFEFVLVACLDWLLVCFLLFCTFVFCLFEVVWLVGIVFVGVCCLLLFDCYVALVYY